MPGCAGVPCAPATLARFVWQRLGVTPHVGPVDPPYQAAPATLEQPRRREDVNMLSNNSRRSACLTCKATPVMTIPLTSVEGHRRSRTPMMPGHVSPKRPQHMIVSPRRMRRSGAEQNARRPPEVADCQPCLVRGTNAHTRPESNQSAGRQHRSCRNAQVPQQTELHRQTDGLHTNGRNSSRPSRHSSANSAPQGMRRGGVGALHVSYAS